MALGFFQHLAVAWSGGSEPASTTNPAAIAAMAERGIDISAEYPKPWTDEVAQMAAALLHLSPRQRRGAGHLRRIATRRAGQRGRPPGHGRDRHRPYPTSSPRIFPGKRYLDWELTDPAGKTAEQIRHIRYDIDTRVRALLAELVPATT
jgi:arsenate reductase (thioredoxin)